MPRPKGYAKQREMICAECPLESCSEDSLWCLYRFVTKPNEAQKQLLMTKASYRLREYQQAYYIANQDRIKERQRERYRARKVKEMRG